ncbi:MAG: relaxase domain-containing protein [Actinomycetota bacterium]|nr:relaxase domain-containing protein [Actinomycetota bacterium]
MLNIGKLRRGGENYYLNSVARGVEDYYLGSGEAPGYWLASGAADLGLEGQVGESGLRNVLRGADPFSAAPLGKGPTRERVPGFDLTFLAPKSVALLHELGSKEASNEVVNAHDAAVAAALGYLERQASGARRGKGGKTAIASKGFIAAAFRHRTSRAGDPLLHTHVLVANLIRGSDGKWGALDAKHLYRHAKTAGYLYQAQLRKELTRRLGVEWSRVHNGAADIEGIDRTVIRAFSRRRLEVEAVLAERTDASGREREVAALTTRQAKDYSVSPQRLLPQWREKAEQLGLRTEVLERTLQRTRDAAITHDEAASIMDRLAAPGGLTEQQSAFTRRDAIQGLCEQMQQGADVAEVEALADAFLASDLVVPLAAREGGVTEVGSRRVSEGRLSSSTVESVYSTADMLSVEHQVVERALERRFDGVGLAEPFALHTAIARRPTLFDDQQAMVTRLTTSGLGVEVVVGKAGAGKTFALDAAREAWEMSGTPVIGCALAARAAQELQVGSGIQSYTIDALLMDLDHPESAGLPSDSVLVVDEAGMVGTRKLAQVFRHADQANAKVVLVGDDRQLPEIQAGGAFRGIKNRLPAIELSEVRRQPFGWEREALDLIREGRSEEAIAEYEERGRVHVATSAEDTRRQLVADWWSTRDEAEPGVMIAARRSDVADLNDRARALMRAQGRIDDHELEVAGQSFSVGDRVMTLKNTRRLGVINGTRATVQAVHHDRGELTIRREDGTDVTLPASYLEAGHLTHAYAITGHKAQGMTTQKAFVLGDQTLYREWAYVAMSRGKENNSLYVVAGIDAERSDAGGQVERIVDPTKELIRAVGRSRAKDLALDVYEHAEIKNLSYKELRAEWERLGQELGGVPADASAEAARTEAEKRDLETAIRREKERSRAARAELAAMSFVARRREPRRAARLQRRTADADRLVARMEKERVGLEERQATIDRQLRDREEWLIDHAPQVRRRFALERELWWREHQSALAAEVAMPDYLVATVGGRPETPSERGAWKQAVKAVETYRQRWGINDQASGLGNEARGRAQRSDRAEVERRLAREHDPEASREREAPSLERSLEL